MGLNWGFREQIEKCKQFINRDLAQVSDIIIDQKVPKVGRKSTKRNQSGTQAGFKNRPKTGLDRQKCFPRWRRKLSSSISCAISVRSHIPDRFWQGLNLQNPIISTVGARFSQNHGFHIFLEFWPQMGPQIQGFWQKTRTEGLQNHQNNRKMYLFGRSKVRSNFGRKKTRKKKNWNPKLVAHGGWPAQCTTSVGG